MIYLYGIFSLSLLIFGVFNFIKNNSQRVYSFILIFLSLQFCFEFIEIIQRTVFADPASSLMGFSVIEMSIDKMKSYHLMILISGILSCVLGNIFFRNYFISNNRYTVTKKTQLKRSYIK